MNAPSDRSATYWTGKVALVAGGSSGLGRAIAVELARQGARVAIAARGSGPIDAVVAELRAAGAEVLGIAADVTRQADVDRLVDETVTRFGRLDLLVNAVGRSARGAALSTTPEEFAELLELNLLAAVRMTRAAAPHLLRSYGHLVNIGSLAASLPADTWVAIRPVNSRLAGYTAAVAIGAGRRRVEGAVGLPRPDCARGSAAIRNDRSEPSGQCPAARRRHSRAGDGRRRRRPAGVASGRA